MESPDNPEVVPVPESNNNINDDNMQDDSQVSVEKARQIEEATNMWPEYCNPAYVMPDVIEVKVTTEDESYFFPVTVVKMTEGSKKYLGGYRNKQNGRIYHHANTQTPTDAQKLGSKDYSNLRTRETQTLVVRSLSVQPYRENGTQMERVDVMLDNSRDKVIVPKIYFTSEELLLLKKMKTIEIQRVWRGFMARCLARQIRQRNVDFALKSEADREAELNALREQRVADQGRRTHPKSNADFAVLYNELDEWRKGEIAKIKATTTNPEERKLAMSALLINETKALQSLQKLKLNAHKEIHVEKTQAMLEAMSKPHVWQLSHGETAQVQTAETQRARELLDLFNALNAPVVGTDQRLDILLNVKWTASEFDTPVTRQIKELVDREADLLSRGRPLRSMQNLRQRISNLFLQFIEDYKYNPRAKDFIVDPSGLTGVATRK